MRGDDFVTHPVHADVPADDGAMGYGFRPRWRSYREAQPMRTISLIARGKGALCRISYVIGSEREERAARKWIDDQSSAWWYNAPQYCGGGLEIVEG